MEMNIHHDTKTVDIWLTRSEARDENIRRSLELYYRQFANHRYFVSVFESGDRELLPDTALFRNQVSFRRMERYSSYAKTRLRSELFI